MARDKNQDDFLRLLIEDSQLNEALWLVKCGVPFDVAFTLSPDERFAFAVIMGRFEGNKFDFNTMSFVKSSG